MKKMFGPGGVPQPYRPHSAETKRKIGEAVRRVTEGKRLAQKRRAGKISAKKNPPIMRVAVPRYLPGAY